MGLLRGPHGLALITVTIYYALILCQAQRKSLLYTKALAHYWGSIKICGINEKLIQIFTEAPGASLEIHEGTGALKGIT